MTALGKRSNISSAVLRIQPEQSDRQLRGGDMGDEGTHHTVLSKRIKEERKYSGLSQEEVARCLGMPRRAVSVIESGALRISTEELRRLAELNQTAMESLTGHGTEEVDPE